MVDSFTGEKQKRRRCFLQSGHEHWSTGLNFYTKRDKLLDIITYITQRYKHHPEVRNTTNETYKYSHEGNGLTRSLAITDMIRIRGLSWYNTEFS